VAKLDARRQDLAASAYPRALAHAKRLGRRHPPLADEFTSAAGLAVTLAAANAPEDMGPERFFLYAMKYVHFGMMKVFRDGRPVGFRHNRARPPDAIPIEDMDTQASQFVGPEPEPAEAIAYLDRVVSLARRLPPRHAAAFLSLNAFAGRRLIPTAAALGVDKKHVCTLRQEAIAYLRLWTDADNLGIPQGALGEVRAESQAFLDRRAKRRAGRGGGQSGAAPMFAACPG
jgi:hypothetical protein